MRHRFIFAVCALLMALGLQQLPAAADGSIRTRPTERLMPQALVVPVLGAAVSSVVVTANGFAPLEAVTFRFGFVDPFTGTISHPVFSVSGVTDAAGRLSNRWGSVPVPPQTLLAASGLYTLQATGGASGDIATTLVSLPFLLIASGLQCPARPLPPGWYGYAFADSTAAFAPETMAAGAVGLPIPLDVAARVNREGQLLGVFRIPWQTPPGSYPLIVAGLHVGIGHQEQLLTCTLTVTAE